MSRLSLDVDLFSQDPATWQGDAAVLAVFEGGVPQEALAMLGEVMTAEVRRVLEAGWMRGKADELMTLTVPRDAGLHISRVLLLGMGKPAKITLESVRQWGGRVTDVCNRTNVQQALLLLSLDRLKEIKANDLVEALAEGLWLADYRFDHYHQDKEDLTSRTLHTVSLAVREKAVTRRRQDLERVAKIVQAVYLARDMANHPPNRMTPEDVAKIALDLSHHLPVRVTVLDEKKLEEKGMHALLGVGQGSVHPPRLIILEYRGTGEEKPPLAVVGKTITFDAGGISLKPAANMGNNKYDMSGGAAVMGFIQAAAELKLPINIVGILAAAENLPSGSAQRPGDIVKTAKGLFVEIQNTDAEGRLVLCDAIHYAERFNPHTIIDLATLTGACVVALGTHASGLFANDKRLANALIEAGQHTGERVWELPLFEEYQAALKTPVADLRNIGDGHAGAIIGACFIARFVGENRRWAHLDIAGTAWDMDNKRAYIPKGSVGVGVRLLCRLAIEYFT